MTTVGLPTTSTPRKVLPSVAVDSGPVDAGLGQSNAAEVPDTESHQPVAASVGVNPGLHQCTMCPYNTKKIFNYRRHLSTHRQKYEHICPRCDAKFPTHIDLADHKRNCKNCPIFIVIDVARNLHLRKAYRDTSCQFIRTLDRSNAASVIRHFRVN